MQNKMQNKMRWRRPSFGWPALAALVLSITAFVARDPVVDALTGGPVADVRLGFSFSYLVLAPVLAAFDHLSFLTDRQHLVVLVSLILLFVGWRVGRRILGHAGSPWVLRECLVALFSLIGLIAFYGFGVLGVRPMASLRSEDPDLVIVDFHSHTEVSHDGRPGFDVSARRAWHRGAGFDLAYLTDHLSLDAVGEASAANPALAGEGLSFLPGREVRFKNQHIVVLGSEDPAAGVPDHAPWPVLIQTIPNDLSRVPVPDADGERGGVYAIELVDADPRGLRQSGEDREMLLAIADSLNLALVAGSNHHGWGRAAAAWTMFRVPGWRTQSPTEVGREIEDSIRRDRADAGQVVERPRLSPGPGREPVLAELLTLPRLVWHVLTSLTLPERLAWLAWVLVAAAIAGIRAGRVTDLPSDRSPVGG